MKINLYRRARDRGGCRPAGAIAPAARARRRHPVAGAAQRSPLAAAQGGNAGLAGHVIKARATTNRALRDTVRGTTGAPTSAWYAVRRHGTEAVRQLAAGACRGAASAARAPGHHHGQKVTLTERDEAMAWWRSGDFAHQEWRTCYVSDAPANAMLFAVERPRDRRVDPVTNAGSDALIPTAAAATRRGAQPWSSAALRPLSPSTPSPRRLRRLYRVTTTRHPRSSAPRSRWRPAFADARQHGAGSSTDRHPSAGILVTEGCRATAAC